MSAAGTSVDSPRKCSVRVDCGDSPAPLSGDEISTVLLISRGTMSGAARIADCLSQAARCALRHTRGSARRRQQLRRTRHPHRRSNRPGGPGVPAVQRSAPPLPDFHAAGSARVRAPRPPGLFRILRPPAPSADRPLRADPADRSHGNANRPHARGFGPDRSGSARLHPPGGRRARAMGPHDVRCGPSRPGGVRPVRQPGTMVAARRVRITRLDHGTAGFPAHAGVGGPDGERVPLHRGPGGAGLPSGYSSPGDWRHRLGWRRAPGRAVPLRATKCGSCAPWRVPFRVCWKSITSRVTRPPFVRLSPRRTRATGRWNTEEGTMPQLHSEDPAATPPAGLRAMLGRLAQLGETQASALLEQNDLARQRTQTTSNLVVFSSKTAENAEKQTGLATERTALTREQTRLSTRSTELATIRTELARERNSLAEENSRLATQRTDTQMARRRAPIWPPAACTWPKSATAWPSTAPPWPARAPISPPTGQPSPSLARASRCSAPSSPGSALRWPSSAPAWRSLPWASLSCGTSPSPNGRLSMSP